MLFTYNLRGVKGLVTVILRKFFQPFSNKSCLSGTLSVYVEIQV